MDLIKRILAGSHEHTQEHMSAHLDGELKGISGWRFARHLAWCQGCQAVLESLQATVASLRSMRNDRAVDPDPELVDAVRERIAPASEKPES